MPSAERVRWAKFRVAAVCLAALSILSTLIFLLTGGTFLQQHVPLYLYIPDTTGLGKGSPVRVDGIGVGKVQSVELSGSNAPNRIIKVTMEIERDRLASITEDSTAQIASDTLVGDRFVDVSSGSSAKSLQPGGELQFRGSPEMLKSLDIEQFEQRIRVIDAMLTDIEQGRSRVGEFVVGDQLYQDILKRVADLQKGIHAAVSTTTSVGQALYTDQLYRQIRAPILELDQTLARLQSGQGGGGQWLRDDQQYQQFRNSLAELRRSIADLHAGEFMQSDQSYSDWNRLVVSMIQRVDDFNAARVLTSTDVYESLNGAAREILNLSKEFRQNPRKFMRLKVF